MKRKTLASAILNAFWSALKFVLVYTVLLPILLIVGIRVFTTVVTTLNLGNDTVLVSGTGSMYPTFPKGQGQSIEELSQEVVSTPGMIRYPRGIEIGDFDILTYRLQRGDIVAFNNEQTEAITQDLTGRAASFVKRAIALPGDTVELRSGILYLNGEPQLEPYTARARSTFGGESLAECKELTIPESKLLVLGDNRTGSNDSRHDLGLISYSDIHNVIPWSQQFGVLDSLWRDPSNDLDESSIIRLEIDEYVTLINAERETNGLKPLNLNAALSKSAELRGKKILEFNDFSSEATQSGYTMRRSMQDAGYSNIVYGEALVQGYFESQELLDQQLAFPDSKEFLLTPEYQDIGVAAVEGEVNGCPTQVIVRHFGGYVPATYDPTVVQSWETSVNRLKEIQPSWENAVNLGEFYEKNKTEIDRVRAIIAERISMQSKLVTEMQAQRWLNNELEEYMRTRDSQLAEEQAALSSEINN